MYQNKPIIKTYNSISEQEKRVRLVFWQNFQVFSTMEEIIKGLRSACDELKVKKKRKTF